MMKKICIYIILFSLLLISGCDIEYYWDDIGWLMEDETFYSEYYEYVDNYLGELKERYQVEYNKETDFSYENSCITILLYNENMTIDITLKNENSLADIWFNLYYWSYNIEELEDYSIQQKYVDFSDDFLNKIAYDTITSYNCFETLYFEALNIEDGARYGSNIYHFDDFIGNVGYYVKLCSDNSSYYYQYEIDINRVLMCNRYRFEGLCSKYIA